MITPETALVAIQNKQTFFYVGQDDIRSITPKILGEASALSHLRESYSTYHDKYSDRKEDESLCVSDGSIIIPLQKLYLESHEVATIIVQKKQQEIDNLMQTINKAK